MDKERIKGKAEDVAGRVERQVGEWTGNEKAQAEGLAKQAEGKARNAVGKTKDAVRDAADKLKETKIENEEERTLSAIKTSRSFTSAVQQKERPPGALFLFLRATGCLHRQIRLCTNSKSHPGEHGRHGCANLKMVLIGLF